MSKVDPNGLPNLLFLDDYQIIYKPILCVYLTTHKKPTLSFLQENPEKQKHRVLAFRGFKARSPLCLMLTIGVLFVSYDYSPTEFQNPPTNIQPRYASCSYYHSFRHEHQLFDQNPQPNAASTNRSMLNYLHIKLPLEPLTCSVSNFNYICLITSMKLPLPLLSRLVKGTPSPDAKFTGLQFLLG